MDTNRHDQPERDEHERLDQVGRAERGRAELPGWEIDASPTAPESVVLPFLLMDSDRPNARPLASIPVVVPPEMLTTVLFLADRPGELERTPRGQLWATIAGHLLQLGAIALDLQARIAEQNAHHEPELFVWWERCRHTVEALFATSGRDSGHEQPHDTRHEQP